jgi:exonuclease VII large subunit
VLRKQKELEEWCTRAREKSLKQKIEETEATLRELNEQLQNASHEVIHLEEPNSATKVSQEKNFQKSFISIDISSPLSINLHLSQWSLGYKFNMISIFDGQSDLRQFMMSFKAAVISGGDDETTQDQHNNGTLR